LFSDGGDNGNSDATAAAATAAQNAGVHVETVGVGTADGTTVEVDGYRVQTALDADTLTAIAKTTGGSYHPASDAAQLDGIASTINLRLTTHNEPLPLAAAFTVFAIALLAIGAVLTVLRTGRII
ncbi:MAG: VWA domain-containing protein, partial [Actinobacteria bacterium]|nr:VWA domain-containing protein [Actinomycetota bacterium]